MRMDDESQTDADHVAPAEDLDAETLQNIAARHDDRDDLLDALVEYLPDRAERDVTYGDDDAREAYAALELHEIDDEDLISALFHAAGRNVLGEIQCAASRRNKELFNEEYDPLVEPDDDTTVIEESDVDEIELGEPVSAGGATDLDDLREQPRDDRLSGVDAAEAHAQALHEERTEVVEWDYKRTADDDYERTPETVSFPDGEQLAADVARNTVGATYYRETEERTVIDEKGVETGIEVERYVVAIDGEDREVVFHPRTSSVGTRRATPVPADDVDDDQELLSPPTYADDDRGGGLGAELVAPDEADEAGENDD